MQIKYFLYIQLCLFLIACQKQKPEIEKVLSEAGDNRKELFHVLQHYEENNDTLKLRAAQFLIENMENKMFLSGHKIDEYYTFIDSVYQIEQEEYDIEAINRGFLEHAIYWGEQPTIQLDMRTLSADQLISNIDEAFAVWNRPWNQHLSFDEFCEWILPYRISYEIPETWRTIYRKQFESLIMADSIQTAKQACNTMNNILARQYNIHIKDMLLPISLRPSTLLQIKYGPCNDYSNFAILAMRAAGIPVAIETVPHWGRGNNRHLFCVVYNNDGTSHDFAGIEGNTTDQHLIRFRHEIPKVYRKTYGKQKESLALQCGNEDIPEYFKNPNMVDATANYHFIGARDITIDLTKKTNLRFAYLCVFDPEGWTPVAWGTTDKAQAHFKAIGPNIVYQPALYADGKLRPTGNPFLLDTLGQITYFKPQSERFDFVLERKYRPAAFLDYLPPIMLGGKFQGANKPDFSDAMTLYTFTEEPNFKYTTVECNLPQAFKYLRYQASDRTSGNIAELEFYTKNSDTPLKGNIIGEYKPSIYYPRYGANVMFDGNPLTFFHADGLGPWGGIALELPETITRIRYLIRNDDNGIRKGHDYELFYMNQGEWTSLGRKAATEDDRLPYTDLPKSALFWLHDYTGGVEERIFTINNNQVIWH